MTKPNNTFFIVFPPAEKILTANSKNQKLNDLQSFSSGVIYLNCLVGIMGIFDDKPKTGICSECGIRYVARDPHNGFSSWGMCSRRCFERSWAETMDFYDVDDPDNPAYSNPAYAKSKKVRKVDYTEQFKAHNKARKKLIEAEKQKAKEKPNETNHKSNQEQSKSSAKPTPAKILASGVIMISTSLLLFWIEEGLISLFGLFGAIFFSCLLIANFKKLG